MDAGLVALSLVPTVLLVVLFKILRRAIQSERWVRMRGSEVISVAIALSFVMAFLWAVTLIVLTIRAGFSEGTTAVLAALSIFLATVYASSRALDLLIKPVLMRPTVQADAIPHEVERG